jgi:hypothetical protein
MRDECRLREAAALQQLPDRGVGPGEVWPHQSRMVRIGGAVGARSLSA